MANNYWRTPSQIINYIESRFGEIKLDVCAKDKKAAVCSNFISEEMDAFKCDWWQLLSVGELMWMNPPYSDTYPWVKKLGEQIKQGNGRCAAGILNLDPSTKWFYELESYATLIMPIIKNMGTLITKAEEDTRPERLRPESPPVWWPKRS